MSLFSRHILLSMLFGFFSLFSYTATSAAENSIHSRIFKVKDYQAKNVIFTTQQLLPKLLSYNIEFKIDENHLLVARIDADNPGGAIFYPSELLSNGDDLQILQEGYILDQDNQSWFKIRILKTGLEFDAQGPSLTSKFPANDDPATVFAKHVRIKNSEDKYEVSFTLNDYYVTLQADSFKFHGYYEDKPYSILDLRQEKTGAGRGYANILVVQDLETNELIEMTSLFDCISIAKIEVIDPVADWRGGGMIVVGFKLKYIFTDGSEYKTTQIGTSTKFWEKYGNEKGYARYLLEERGNDFVILKETLDPKNSSSATLQLRSLKNDETIELHGPSRK